MNIASDYSSVEVREPFIYAAKHGAQLAELQERFPNGCMNAWRRLLWTLKRMHDRELTLPSVYLCQYRKSAESRELSVIRRASLSAQNFAAPF